MPTIILNITCTAETRPSSVAIDVTADPTPRGPVEWSDAAIKAADLLALRVLGPTQGETVEYMPNERTRLYRVPSRCSDGWTKLDTTAHR